MKLIVKRGDQYEELDYVPGRGIVGVSIQSVQFNFKDVSNTEAFLKDLRETILPRMPAATEADFLPDETKP